LLVLPPKPFCLPRRDFLRHGSGLAAAGFWFSPKGQATRAQAESSARTTAFGRAKSCILVYLLGGPPHQDMFDLKPLAPAEVRGQFRPIATNVPGIDICEHLPRLSGLADRYALIRSVSYRNSNHTPMIYYTLTGRPTERPQEDNDIRPPQQSDFPHIGSILASVKRAPGPLPGYVAIPECAIRSSLRGEFKRVRSPLRGGSAGFLGSNFDPLVVNGEPGTLEAVPSLALPEQVNPQRFDQRAQLLSILETRGPASRAEGRFDEVRDRAVVLTGATSKGRIDTFSLDREPAKTRERYGDHRFGRAMLLARRLAQAQVPMVAIHFNEMTVCDGWDTHGKNFEALQTELLPMVDQSLSALLEDLEERGILEQTLVICMGEFGRTPKINANAGRDHWGDCSTTLLAGGGIQGGQVYGASDKIAAYPTVDPVDPVDVHATIYECMGVDRHDYLFDHLARPWEICTGQVITRLL
jgi:hypothetical protein